MKVKEIQQDENASRDDVRHKEIKPYSEIRAHFIQRLSERYGLSITTKEYDECARKRPGFILWYKINQTNALCSIKIKGQYVLCVYGKKIMARREDSGERKVLQPAKIITCLNIEGYLPCPAYLIYRGFNKFKFEDAINERIKGVIALSDEYIQMGARDFFMKHPAKIYLKAAAKAWALTGTMRIHTLVYGLYLELLNEQKENYSHTKLNKMGHHLNAKGFFQSDKNPELPENKIILDFRDEYAQKALLAYASFTHDTELAEDIRAAIDKVQIAGLTKKPD